MKVVLPEVTSKMREILERNGVGPLLAGGECPHLEGVWGSGSAAVLAALLEEFPERTFLVVTPSQKSALDFLGDLPTFSDAPALFYPWMSDRDTLGDSPETPDAEDTQDPDAPQLPEDEVLATYIPDASVAERLLTLKTLWNAREQRGGRAVVVAPVQSLLKPCPRPGMLRNATLELRCGAGLPLDTLTDWLVSHGFQNTTSVRYPGEFFARGGLVDIYAVEWERPLRIEFFGDQIESIRDFDLETQRSLDRRECVEVTSFLPLLQPLKVSQRADLTAFLPADALVFQLEPEEIQLQGHRFYRGQERPETLFSMEEVFRNVARLPFLSVASVGEGTFGPEFHLGMESVERFSGDFARVKDELEKFAAGQSVFLLCPNEAEKERLKTFFADTDLARCRSLECRVGAVSEGFRLVAARQLVLTSGALFCRDGSQSAGAAAHTRPRHATKIIDTFSELREGDFVVHVSFGVAKYRGLKLVEPLKQKGQPPAAVSGVPNVQGAEEHLVLEFRDNVTVYVPVSKIALVQKYINGGNAAPALSKYGGRAWEHAKKAVAEAVSDLAAEMLDMQAVRMARPGIAFPTGTALQREFDAVFPYTETPDQLAATDAIRSDMAASRPMDRLLCGDVGFGKTELAMRAAFTAVEAGYQVAILVPTTVLAAQHMRSFTQRMATFPVRLACLSRFNTPQEERVTLQDVVTGGVDILIGTHRIASQDVKFANLGLVIIDEEQRFGVEMKEALKRFRSTVDVLTMTATPIPRTLHMSLLGIRDISSLETPPLGRVAVETRVTRFQDALVRSAIMREIDRDGQVYFVHNRVYDILNVRDRLQNLVPEARIVVGHAQMHERELERAMTAFVEHRCDVLLCTTIVENGLDIPNANTIFIDEANRFGLAELHQLRGRVGRYKNHAYCYLLLNGRSRVTSDALRRLKAIEEFSHLGSGFHIAMRDLEIRGTGNILGTRQSGQIALVGYELYCDLLESAVRRLKRMPPRETVVVDVNLPITAYIPHQFVPDMRQKIDLYRRLSRLTRVEEVDDFATELEDRFGPLPPPLQRLLKLAKVRIWAHMWLITSMRRKDDFVIFEFFSHKAIEPLTRRKLGEEGLSLRIVDANIAYLPLDEKAKNSPPDAAFLLNYLEVLLRQS